MQFIKRDGDWRMSNIWNRYWRFLLCTGSIRRFTNVILCYLEMVNCSLMPKSHPVVLRIETTNRCNYCCPKCACGSGLDPRPKSDIDLCSAKGLIDEFSRYGMIVRLDGLGEPLLHENCYELIKYATDLGLSTMLSSNLSIIPGGVSALIDSGLSHIIVSIDGLTQDVYEKYRVGGNLTNVLSNLNELIAAKKASGRGPYIEVQYLEMDHNKNHTIEFKKLTKNWPVEKVTIISICNQKSALAKVGKPKRCYWLWFVLTVDSSGYYKLCANAFTYKFPSITIDEMSVSEFWTSKHLSNARLFNKNTNNVQFSHTDNCRCQKCSEMLVVDRTERVLQHSICT